jgi:serine/threonine protein phosphatase PrpC
MARYQLLRYVGHPDRPEPDLLGVTLHPGDVYALCTDGVAEQVDYARLRDLLGGGADPADIAARVLEHSLAAGGRDNATIAVVRVDAAPAGDGPASA